MTYLRLASIYLGIGVVSGIVSGLSTELKPFGLIIPGPVFGGFFVGAAVLAGRPLRWPWIFACLASGAFVVADLAFLLSVGFTLSSGFTNGGAAGSAIAGGFSGFLGASILAMYAGIEHEFEWPIFFLVSVAGGLLSAATMPVVIHFKDNGSLAEPLGFILLFATWQAGTMATLGLSRHLLFVQNRELHI